MSASYSFKAERLRAYRKYPPLSHFIHYKSEVYHIFKQKLDKSCTYFQNATMTLAFKWEECSIEFWHAITVEPYITKSETTEGFYKAS